MASIPNHIFNCSFPISINYTHIKAELSKIPWTARRILSQPQRPLIASSASSNLKVIKGRMTFRDYKLSSTSKNAFWRWKFPLKTINHLWKWLQKMMNDHCLNKRMYTDRDEGEGPEKHWPRRKTSLPMAVEGASVSNGTGSKTASWNINRYE